MEDARHKFLGCNTKTKECKLNPSGCNMKDKECTINTNRMKNEAFMMQVWGSNFGCYATWWNLSYAKHF